MYEPLFFSGTLEPNNSQSLFGSAMDEVCVHPYIRMTLAHVTEAKKMLEESMAGEFRRNRPHERSAVHSLRVGDRAKELLEKTGITGDALKAYGFRGNEFVNFVVVLACLHDLVEEGKIKFPEIENKFGRLMAYNVSLLTTPDLHVLVKEYADTVVKKDFPAVPTKNCKTDKDYQALLAKLEAKQPDVFINLKTALVHHKKHEQSKRYGLATWLVRSLDNSDPLKCDAEDISKGAHIEVVASNQLSSKSNPTNNATGKVRLTTADIDRKSQKRAELHDMYVQRGIQLCEEVSRKYVELKRPTKQLLRAVNDEFQSSAGELWRVITRISLSVRNGPLRTLNLMRRGRRTTPQTTALPSTTRPSLARRSVARLQAA